MQYLNINGIQINTIDRLYQNFVFLRRSYTKFYQILYSPNGRIPIVEILYLVPFFHVPHRNFIRTQATQALPKRGST